MMVAGTGTPIQAVQPTSKPQQCTKLRMCWAIGLLRIRLSVEQREQ